MNPIGVLPFLLCCWCGIAPAVASFAPFECGNVATARADFKGLCLDPYHNPETGRFWTQDSYEGNQSDPLSLHKYTHCGNNPVNAFDPSGQSSLGEVMQTAGIIGSLTLIANVGITGYGTSSAMADSDGLPDGAIFSISAVAASSGGSISGGFDVVYHFKSGRFYLYGTFAGGFSPLSYFKAFKAAPFSSSVTGGLIWNFNDPNEWSGTGYTATWPGSASFLLARAMGRTNPMWGALSQLAKREHNVKWSDYVVQIGVSTSGPAALKFGLRSNSFSAEGGLATAPVELNSLGADVSTLLNDIQIDLSALQSGNINNILRGLR